MNRPDSTSLQGLLARILVDARLADELRDDPVRFSRVHGVDENAARQLAALPCGGFAVTASTARYSRESWVRASFPATFALVAATEDESRLMQVCLEHGTFDDAAATGRRLGAAVEPPSGGVGTRDRLLAEAVSFETCSHEARAQWNAVAPAPTARPVLRPGVLVAGFSRPMAEVVRMILQGPVPHEFPEGATHYVMRATAKSDPVRCYRIAPKLAHMLLSCDGSRSTSEVAEAVGILRESVERSLHSLAAMEFIAWIPDVGSNM
ncbi:hypothetical protein [Streptomyces sp. NPDC003036]|uniref:hypothetical protein n=1 Tax=Streptomyces sp. NPDC003036 TaxID=3154442 RepID=UPI0033A02EAD